MAIFRVDIFECDGDWNIYFRVMEIVGVNILNWSKGIAEWVGGDTAFISVVFSWRLPDAYQRAVWYKTQGYHVRAGGPAVWVRPKYLADVAEIGGEVDALIHHNPLTSIS